MQNNLGIELPTTEINCGIGTIEYTADNVQLELLMEALSAKISATNPLTVLNLLR